MHGQLRLRQAIAGFLTEHTRAPQALDPAALCVLNGAGTVIDTLMQAICDPGDAMLIPTPFYGGFETDLERRAGARCWGVPTTSATQFQLSRADLEASLAAAARAGASRAAIEGDIAVRVRG